METMIKQFNNNEVILDFSQDRVNLKDVAFCCGLTKKKGNKLYVRWTDKGVGEKLNNILSCDNLNIDMVDEIKDTLQQIKETKDRNSISISSWLAKRLATECRSQTAMEFKNWLVTLDEDRENGLVQPRINNNISMDLVQDMVSRSVTEVMKQIMPMMNY